MLRIDTTHLTARQLHHIDPLLPPTAIFSPRRTIDLNPADCTSRDTLLAWLAATAPLCWYDGTIVPVHEEHIARGRPCRARSCALALALRDATGEPWDVTATHCHALPTVARTWYIPYTLSPGVRDFLARFDRVPKPLIPPTTFVLRIADPEAAHHGPRPILGLYHHEDDHEHA